MELPLLEVLNLSLAARFRFEGATPIAASRLRCKQCRQLGKATIALARDV
jgi:hypothetical protein